VVSDSTGDYSVTGVAAGNVGINASARGFDGATLSTVLSGDSIVDLQLDPTVEFRVIGTAFHVLITLQVGTFTIMDAGSAPQFTFVFPGMPQPGDTLSLTAKIDGQADTGDVTVSIYKHGRPFQTATAHGFPSSATVSGSF
jgi:hypothetical protein